MVGEVVQRLRRPRQRHQSYPVANAFSETLVDKNDEQWDWLDQSYRIDA
ncbi:endo-alpha-N-acetylgalactosaminidase family protein, partial [Streptomyces niveus]